MFKKPVFWITLTILSIAGGLFTYRFFPLAYPIVNLDLQMDRQTALTAAEQFSASLGLGPAGFDQAASFDLDNKFQNYVELEAGGAEVFSGILEDKIYYPYTWHVRHYMESEVNETEIRFTPGGEPYGFVETLSEKAPGAALMPDSAQAIAEQNARLFLNTDLSVYNLVEKSKEVRPGGRVDHTFVYERGDVKIGDARYRMRLVISGDKFTELTHFVKIPEAFSRRYSEMRSSNETISAGAVVGLVIFYVLGGMIIGLFFLIRQRWILWRKPLFWGIFVALLQILNSLNQWPLLWMRYDTALSAQGFVMQQIVGLLVSFIGLTILFTLSFMAAESLTRKAFPNHLRFWNIWSKESASSPVVWGQTFGGYLAVGLFFAFDVGLYFFATRYLGWWSPSEALFEPDVLASYFPWLSSIAISFQAGFMEECLFRAIPIAGAALIGQKYGHRTAWIFAAFILQAVIFGAAHANYPQQPSYARLAELIIPSIGFGLVYLYFGLLPGIILHYAVDVVWFALPLFVSTAPGIWADRLMVLILVLVPLWIILFARLRSKKWTAVRDEQLNGSWTPAPSKEAKPGTSLPKKELSLGKNTGYILIFVGIAGLVLWIFTANFKNEAPRMDLQKAEAVHLADSIMKEKNIQLSEEWRMLSCIESTNDANDRMIWQTEGSERYAGLIGNYLSPPFWKFRYVRFEGDVAERAEEYQILIQDENNIRFRHILPEAKPGAVLEEGAAKNIADSVIINLYGMDPAALKLISVEPSRLENRLDWNITYADTAAFSTENGEARISVFIAGDEVTDSNRYIYVKEEWEREEVNRMNLTRLARGLVIMSVVLIFLAGIIAAIVAWSRKNLSPSVFLWILALIIGTGIIDIINEWNCSVAKFSTSEPYFNQMILAIVMPIMLILFIAAGPAFIGGFAQRWKRPGKDNGSFALILSGIAIGMLFAGLLSSAGSFTGPVLKPVWAEYIFIAGSVPLLGAALQPIVGYMIITALLLFVFTAVDRFSDGWSVKKTLSAAALFLFGFIYSGFAIDNLNLWMAMGIISGLYFIIMYIAVFRFQPAIIPLMSGTIMILGSVKQGVFNAAPGALPGAVLSALILAVISVIWFRRLLKTT
ncbi:MAG: CPBP family glutamic-type intramembrane protease [Calditrichaceae bacterium]